MNDVLYIREIIVRFYKKYEVIFIFAFKFLAALFIFSSINGIGNYREEFAPLFESSMSFPFLLLISLLFAIAPPTLANTFVVALLLIQSSSALIPMVFIGLLLVLVLVLYCRLSPERSFLILAVLIAYKFNMPYVVVIFAGVYYGISSIAPITISVFINGFIPFFLDMIRTLRMPEELDLTEIPVMFLDTYKSIFEAFTGNFDWLFVAFVFAIVVIAVHSISKLFTDYCVEIAIAVGSFINIIGFICAGIFIGIETSIFSVILLTVISALLVEIFHFFDVVLDYDRAEKVQFEDEENYYYVKIVPKLLVELPEDKKVKTKKIEEKKTEETRKFTRVVSDTDTYEPDEDENMHTKKHPHIDMRKQTEGDISVHDNANYEENDDE